MCDPAQAVRRFGGFAFLVLTAAVLGAQSAAEFRARAEALLPSYLEATHRMRVADHLRALAESPETLQVGHLTVLTAHALRPVVEPAALQAWPVIEERFGSTSLLLEQRAVIVFTPDSGKSYSAVQAAGGGRPVTSQDLGSDPKAIAAALVRFASLNIWELSDSALRSWLPGALELTSDLGQQREWAYYNLVTSPTTAAGSCLIGNLGACEEALGIVTSGNPLTRLYDASGRRALVHRFGASLNRRPLQLLYYNCVSENSDAACHEILQSALDTGFIRKWHLEDVPGLVGELPPPLGSSARSTLLAVMADLGGRGAWSRLVEAAELPLERRLASGAGVPIDSLVSAWRSGILRARPSPVALPRRTAWATLFWATGICVLGMRSSRWR
jgi:hypothetical protein